MKLDYRLLFGLGPALVLVLAAYQHARDPRLLSASLEATYGLATAITRQLGRVVTLSELALGLGSIGVLTWSEVADGHSAAGAVVLVQGLIALEYFAFALHVRAVVRRSRAQGASLPCGCSSSGRSTTYWHVVRASLLGVLAATAPVFPTSSGGVAVGFAIASGLALALALWVLPEALAYDELADALDSHLHRAAAAAVAPLQVPRLAGSFRENDDRMKARPYEP